MSLGLLGRKVGMTRVFTDEGDTIPVTVIDVSDNRVTQLKSTETDGYAAVQVAFGSRRPSRVTKPLAGHFAKAGVEAGEILGEFIVSSEALATMTLGHHVLAEIFAPGQLVDVTGTTQGKGFSGVISRHNFSSQRASHGNSRSHNVPGSIGGAGPRQGLSGQEDAGPRWRCQAHDSEPRGGSHRHQPPARAHQGCGSRLKGWPRDHSTGRSVGLEGVRGAPNGTHALKRCRPIRRNGAGK